MRLTVYLLFLSVMQVIAGAAYSQNDHVTIESKNATVKEIFSEIQANSQYRFFYSDDLIDLDKEIKVSITDQPVELAMTDISSKTGLSFKILEDNLIVISPNTQNQARTVTGTVTSMMDQEAIPGVNVILQGSGAGTITDIDGNYSLQIDGENAILVFSYVGFVSEEIEVGNQSIINVTLVESIESLEEIVVTAMNIERDKSSLGYSISQVDSEEFTEVKQNNPLNSLQGKVAGLQINTIPSGVDGSSRVVLRGVSSINGSNRPLIVIDGIPVDGGSYGTQRDKDMGDALSDINPEDIESVSVLKGAGAAAAYGSRGGNGVILISTKKGTARKGIGITFNSSYFIEDPYLFPRMQDEYGQGAFGDYPSNISSIKGQEPYIWSWGPRMEGQIETDFLGNESPVVAQPNPYEQFYETGATFMNTVGFDGGDENSSFRASITNQNSTGVYPGNKLSKQTLNFRGSSKLGKVAEVDGKVTYIHSKVKDRPFLNESESNPGFAFNNMPRNISLIDLENNLVDEKGTEVWAWDRTAGNPYWANEFRKNEDEKDRFQSFLSTKFFIAKNLDLLGRTGIDLTNRHVKEWSAASGRNNSSFNGRYYNYMDKRLEWNTDLLLNYNYQITNDLNLAINLGGNYRYNQYNRISQEGSNWRVPDFYHMSNLEDFTTGEDFNEKEVWALFGLGQISWKNYLYFDFTLRNDWSSTLPTKDNANSYFYHSENLSIMFTELLQLESNFLTTGKLRASYAVVGNDTGPYQTNNYYSVSQSQLPYPVGSIDNKLAFADFKPELTTSWEVGTNIGFWNNRLFVDLTYYNAVTANQIMDEQLAPSTGFESRKLNAGEVKNSGFEVELGGSVLSSNSQLGWEISINGSNNKSEVVSLYEGKENLVLKRSVNGWAFVEARPGEPFGAIYGYDFARDESGNKIVRKDGGTYRGEYKNLGDINPDLIAGMSNRFSYKGFNLSFLLDMRLGGEYYSHSSIYRDLFGTSEASLRGREEWYSTHQGPGHFEPIPGVFPDGYIEDGINEETGQPNDVPVQPLFRYVDVVVNNTVVADYIMDATNVRLREFSIGYEFPREMLERTFINRLNLSFVGRNLFFLYNANKDIDPESGFDSGNIGSAFEQNTMPGTRSYGFNLNVNF